MDIMRAKAPGGRLFPHLTLLPRVTGSLPIAAVQPSRGVHPASCQEWLADRKLWSDRKGARSLQQQWKVSGRSAARGLNPRYVHLCGGICI